jgi:hypothetical protein
MPTTILRDLSLCTENLSCRSIPGPLGTISRKRGLRDPPGCKDQRFRGCLPVLGQKLTFANAHREMHCLLRDALLYVLALLECFPLLCPVCLAKVQSAHSI